MCTVTCFSEIVASCLSKLWGLLAGPRLVLLFITKGGARNRYARYGITFARPTSETKNGPTKGTTILPNLRFRIYTKITSTLQQVKSRQPHATRQHVHKMVVSFVLGFSLHGAPHPRVLRLTCGSTTACQGPRLVCRSRIPTLPITRAMVGRRQRNVLLSAESTISAAHATMCHHISLCCIMTAIMYLLTLGLNGSEAANFSAPW